MCYKSRSEKWKTQWKAKNAICDRCFTKVSIIFASFIVKTTSHSNFPTFFWYKTAHISHLFLSMNFSLQFKLYPTELSSTKCFLKILLFYIWKKRLHYISKRKKNSLLHWLIQLNAKTRLHAQSKKKKRKDFITIRNLCLCYWWLSKLWSEKVSLVYLKQQM